MGRTAASRAMWAWGLLAAACAARSETTGGGSVGTTNVTTSAGTTSTTSSTGGTAGSGGAGGVAPSKSCKVSDGYLDALPTCGPPLAPVDGVTLVEKWRYHPSDPEWEVVNVPLVANLTDDNGDGAIDLCDAPDVLVQLGRADVTPPRFQLLVLSGKDGSLEQVIDPGDLSCSAPAIADLDGDGVPEIIAPNSAGHIMALSPSGAVLWEGTAEVFDPIGINQVDPTPPPEDTLREIFVYDSAVSVADLNSDGVPEILVGLSVLDNHGDLLFQDATQGAEFGLPAPGNEHGGTIRPIAADLDGDGRSEALFGHVGYRADGTEFFRLPITPGFSAVGDFFGDGTSEVLVTSDEGLSLVSATGALLWGPVQLGDSPPALENCWTHPASVVDIDGDGVPEALVNTCTRRLVLRIGASGPTVLVTASLPTGDYCLPWASGSTAFDFRDLGPDWIAYQDSLSMTVFAGMGPTLLSTSFGTSVNSPHYPVVADIDDDGSADVLLLGICSASGFEADVIAYEDLQHRPSPARRIWNEWNYVADAMREDATLPAAPLPSPKSAFRVQSRLGCATSTPPM